MGIAGGKPVADRPGRGLASRDEPAERVLILDPFRLDAVGLHLRLKPVRIAGSRQPCGMARLEPGRSGTRW